MKYLRSINCNLMTGVAVAALLMAAGTAKAKVIAYSSLQVSNFNIIAGAEIIDLSSLNLVNTTSSAAGLDGIHTSNSNPVNGSPGNPVADSDVVMSCQGQCGGIVQNDYSAIHFTNPAWHFARGDAALTGSFLTPGGMWTATVAETQLTSPATSSGTSGVQSIVNLSTIGFTTGSSGDLSLSFDVFGELRAFSDEAGGVVLSSMDFMIRLFDLTNSREVSIDVSSLNGATNLNSLSVRVSALGIEERSYLIDDSFTLTISGLLADSDYRLQLTQNSDISASGTQTVAVSEPGSLALFGLGLLGIGTFAARRRNSPGLPPATS